MSEASPSKPPSAWLDHLHEAGHWDRLIEMASQSLATDPCNATVHRHLSWAYAKTGRVQEMRPHLEFLLNDDPDEPRNHHLAAIYHLDTDKHRLAEPHLDLLLANSPRDATYHYLACIYHLRCNQTTLARDHIQQARALAPEWAAAAHLEIRMDGIHQTKAREAWNHIHRLEKALALDPEDADIMVTIGDILLQKLECPREAERFYRQALSIDPMDKKLQGKLLDALRTRSLLYRTLCLPQTVFQKVKSRTGWPVMIVALHGAVFFFVWMVWVGMFFLPAAKIYEWFVLTDIAQNRGTAPWGEPWNTILGWPLWLRLWAVWSVIIAVWTQAIVLLHGDTYVDALGIVALLLGVHLGLVGAVVGVRKVRARCGQWQEARRQRRQAPPPLPSEAA